MSKTMSLKKKLNEKLNTIIDATVESRKGMIDYHQKEMDEDYCAYFSATADSIYKNHKFIKYFEAMKGPDVDDPIEYLESKIQEFKYTSSRLTPTTNSSTMSLITSVWDLDVTNRMVGILKGWKEDLELIRDEKPCRDIPVNLWDDYDEEDHKGTHMYIEDGGRTPIEFKEKCLKHLVGVMNSDMRIMGASYQDGAFDPWIQIKNISYENLDKLTKELQGMNLEYEGIPFRFYSES
jgi:hypothetical protein